jgi:hypothetical protein
VLTPVLLLDKEMKVAKRNLLDASVKDYTHGLMLAMPQNGF